MANISNSFIQKYALNTPKNMLLNELNFVTDDYFDQTLSNIEQPFNPVAIKSESSASFPSSSFATPLQNRTNNSNREEVSTTTNRSSRGSCNTACGGAPDVFGRPKTPFPPPPRAVKVLQKLEYEDRPNCFLVEWRRITKNNRKVIYKKWYTEKQVDRHCKKLIKQFEKKLEENPLLRQDFVHYQVETILDRTVQGEEVRYLAQWVGWREPTWETLNNLQDYKLMVDEFDVINGIPITKSEEVPSEASKKGTKDNEERPKIVPAVKAKTVLSKLDMGKAGPASYLLDWPVKAGIRSFQVSAANANQTWEKYISLGTKDAIEKFERALRRGTKWAKDRVQFHVESIVKREVKRPGNIRYLVKWVGFDTTSWLLNTELLHCYGHLIKQFEKARVEAAFKGRGASSKKTIELLTSMEVPPMVQENLRKINKRVWSRIVALAGNNGHEGPSVKKRRRQIKQEEEEQQQSSSARKLSF